MPLTYDKQLYQNTRIMVWDNIEDEEFFLSSLSLNDQEIEHYAGLKPHRKKEWLSSRYLCKLLDGDCDRKLVIKDEHNKPSLENSQRHISISHSKHRVAAIISDVIVGIDIQRQEDKISRIQHKFISVAEHKMIDMQHLEDCYHIFWGAKECMYKAYGKREIEFREHMHLYPFRYFSHQLELKGWLRKNEVFQNYNLYTDKLDDYYLVYSILEDV